MNLYYNGLSAECSAKKNKNRFIDSLVENFKKIRKMLNTSIFSIIVLKFNQDRYFGLHVTAAADIRMKKVIESCPRRTL